LKEKLFGVISAVVSYINEEIFDPLVFHNLSIVSTYRYTIPVLVNPDEIFTPVTVSATLPLVIRELKVPVYER